MKQICEKIGQQIYYMPRFGKEPEPLCVGARVVLQQNLWFDGKLLNGSVGEVLEIKYNDLNQQENKLPLYVLVKFDNYAGTEFYTSGSLKGVPVIPILDDDAPLRFKGKKRPKNVQYLPLKGAYGITIHKTQSLTLPGVSVFLDNYEMCPGMDFVSFSRVKSLEHLTILDRKIQDERIVRDKNELFYNPYDHCNKFFEHQLNEQKRLEELSNMPQ